MKIQTVHLELSDGSRHSVTCQNPDYLKVESMGGPKPKAAPMRYMTAVAWAAMVRLGLYSGKLQEFLTADCVQLDVENKSADPTQPGPGTASP